MHHKRHKPRHQRAGKLYFKPHKDNGIDDPPVSEKRGRIEEEEQRLEGDVWNVCGSGIYPAGCPACLGCPWCWSEAM